MSQGRLLGLIGVLVGFGLAAQDAAAFSATYDQKATVGRQVIQSKVSLKDELFRMETTMQGQVSIVIHNADGTFMVMPGEGVAMKTSLMPGQGAVEGADNYAAYLAKQQAQMTGSETVDGHACDVYHFTSEAGEATTAWVATDLQFPIKMEIMSREGKVLVELSNVHVGASVPESSFKLPPGVQLMDMGAMMRGGGN